MKKIYSKIDSDKLILALMRYDDISEYRTDNGVFKCKEIKEYLQRI